MIDNWDLAVKIIDDKNTFKEDENEIYTEN